MKEPMRVNLKATPEVARIVKAAFPDYRKREAVVETFSEHGEQINSYWDEGSKSIFALVDIATMQKKSLPTSTHPFFDVIGRGIGKGENAILSVDRVGNITLKRIPDGLALVEAGWFCGKPVTARVYVNAGTLNARMLTAPSA